MVAVSTEDTYYIFNIHYESKRPLILTNVVIKLRGIFNLQPVAQRDLTGSDKSSYREASFSSTAIPAEVDVCKPEVEAMASPDADLRTWTRTWEIEERFKNIELAIYLEGTKNDE